MLQKILRLLHLAPLNNNILNSNMLHDLLLSLVGKPGSYVRQSGIGAHFEIDDSLKLFTPPELGILNRIVELGYHY